MNIKANQIWKIFIWALLIFIDICFFALAFSLIVSATQEHNHFLLSGLYVSGIFIFLFGLIIFYVLLSFGRLARRQNVDKNVINNLILNGNTSVEEIKQLRKTNLSLRGRNFYK